MTSTRFTLTQHERSYLVALLDRLAVDLGEALQHELGIFGERIDELSDFLVFAQAYADLARSGDVGGYRSKSDYWEKVRLISERRLELAQLQTTSITAFLPPDEREAALFEEVKSQTAEEWERVGKPGRKTDFVHRYAIPLYQQLRATKKRKSYAGFDNLVDLSSGVVRDFLEPCYLMFDQVVTWSGRVIATFRSK